MVRKYGWDFGTAMVQNGFGTMIPKDLLNGKVSNHSTFSNIPETVVTI